MKRRRKPKAVYVPDGGWGWVIVACSFLIHMFVVGTLYALSVLYVSWLEAFHSGKGVTSWIISMAVAVMFGIGPLPGSLSKRFGNRPVVMMGGIMMAGGFFVSSFAMNVYFLIVTVGITTGVGAGCCYLPSVALVAQYFTSKRSFAMGISASGLGFGAFFMAPFMNWLVEYFGWRGTMQILSGISLNMCVLASLMRPLELAPHCRNCRWIEESEWTSDHEDVALMTNDEDEGGEEDKKASKSNDKSSHSRRGEGRPFFCACGRPNQSGIRMFSDNKNMLPINYFLSPTLIQNTLVVLRPDYKLDTKDNAILQHLVVKDEVSRQAKAYSADEMNSKWDSLLDSTQCHCSSAQKTILKQPLGGSLHNLGPSPITHLRRSITFSHIPSTIQRSAKHVHYDIMQDAQSKSNIAITPAVDCDHHTCHSVLSLSSISAEDELDSTSGQCQEIDHKLDSEEGRNRTVNTRAPFSGFNLQFCCAIKRMKSAKVYLQLTQSGLFMVFCVSNFLTNLSFLMPVLYMVDRAVDSGIGKSEAAMLVSLYGTGNIFGKVFFGWLADRKFLDRLLYYIACLCMCGASTCASPLCGSSLILHGLYAATFGCFIGAYATLFPLVTVDLVGMAVVEESFGMLLCFMGTATAFGTPLAGWMFDFTGSYTWAFFLHGTFIIISALMLVPVLVKKGRVSK